MKKITLILSLLLGYIATAQAQNFNYQAAVRDASGALLTNQAIGVRLKVLQGSATGATLYTETHTITSNAYGIINLSIGSGTTTDNFNSLDWSPQNHWIEIAIDKTGGTTYTIMGATKLLNVPYANYAKTSGDKSFSTTANVTSNAPGTIATDDFVFGSTQLDNNTTITSDDHRMIFDKSKAAFRAGRDSGANWSGNKVGNFSGSLGTNNWAGGYAAMAFGDANNASNTSSIAMGESNVASGYAAVAGGLENHATGAESIAMGDGNKATATDAIAFGRKNTSSANSAISIGRGLTSNSFNQITLGHYNQSTVGHNTSFLPTENLLVLGNGTSPTNKSNALTILKNGNTTINGTLTLDADNAGSGKAYTLPGQDGTANQVMTTNGNGAVSWTTPAGDNLGNHRVAQTLYLQDHQIHLRGGTDQFHGLGWFSNNFASTLIDGPVLYGYQGGGLGTTFGGQKLALQWDHNQKVKISNAYTLPTADGTANQVMSTDGAGNLQWTTPSTGTSLPTQTGNNGKVLTTNGTAASWTSDINATSVSTDALKVNNLPAFAADLSGTKVLSGAGSFVGLTGWRTSDPALPKNLFDNGNHFNESTGHFTAPVNGFYYFTAQIRYDGISSGYFRLLLGVNNTTSLNNGLHAISEGDATGTQYHTLNVGGVMKLNAGDKVNVIIYSSSDASWSISDESGFNGYLISRF